MFTEREADSTSTNRRCLGSLAILRIMVRKTDSLLISFTVIFIEVFYSGVAPGARVGFTRARYLLISGRYVSVVHPSGLERACTFLLVLS